MLQLVNFHSREYANIVPTRMVYYMHADL